jgi:zinc/manganese transport system ATP-binding protein
VSPPLASLQGIAGGYRSPLWSGLTVHLAAGELLTVMGSNGTGKTTLLRLLLGQLDPIAGQIAVFGRLPRRGNQRLGYIAQSRPLDADLPLRGLDLVRFGVDGHRWGIATRSRSTRRRVTEALEALGAAAFAAQRVGQLSGGQQQRLRIAQALAADPDLLLADEPLLALDLAGQQTVSGLLDAHRRRAGRAVIVVTHDITPLLAHTDRVLYFGRGGTWALGTPDQVLTTETLSELHQSPVDVLQVRGRLVIVGAPDAAHHDSPVR